MAGLLRPGGKNEGAGLGVVLAAGNAKKHWCVCTCVVVVIVVNKNETCVLLLTPDPIAAAVATAFLDNPSCIRNDAPMMIPL